MDWIGLTSGESKIGSRQWIRLRVPKWYLVQMIAVVLVLQLAVVANAQYLEKLLTYDGPIHHAQVFGVAIQGGGEDILKDDSLVRVDGNRLFWLVKISDVGASGRLSVGTNYQRLVVFMAMTVDDGVVRPTAKELYYALPESLRVGFDSNTIGVVASRKQSSWDVPLPSVLDADYHDLAGHFGTHYEWEMTLNVGDYARIQNDSFQSDSFRAALNVSACRFPAQWLPVDISGFDLAIHYGDVTVDRGVIGPNAGVEEQERGWSRIGYTDFITNPMRK